jgi:hypothetical protein
LEPAADLFDNRIFGNDGIERRIEADDVPYAVRFSHGRRRSGTADKRNHSSENKQSFHIFSRTQHPFFPAGMEFPPDSTAIALKNALSVHTKSWQTTMGGTASWAQEPAEASAEDSATLP